MERKVMDEAPWKRGDTGFQAPTELTLVRPAVNEPAEWPEESQVALSTIDLDKHLNDPLYHLAAALRALTWEQMNEYVEGTSSNPQKIITWARAKMGEEQIVIEAKPPTNGRRA